MGGFHLVNQGKVKKTNNDMDEHLGRTFLKQQDIYRTNYDIVTNTSDDLVNTFEKYEHVRIPYMQKAKRSRNNINKPNANLISRFLHHS